LSSIFFKIFSPQKPDKIKSMTLYNWNALDPEPLNALVSRQCIHADHLTVARLELLKNAFVPEHHHVNEQVTLVQRGALRFLFSGREQIVRAGDILVIPPDVPHSAEALEDTTAIDVFSPPRADWIRGDDAYLRK
jgi:quercetin dioxygenase-like cupin family protein